MNFNISTLVVGLCLSQPVLAQSINIQNPESVAVDGNSTLVLSTGVDSDFGNSAVDGAIYRVGPDGVVSPVDLSDAVGLRNPTSILKLNDRWIIADGTDIVAVELTGQLLWRATAAHDDAFLYDLALTGNDSVLVSDFGTGRLFSVDPNSGAMSAFEFDQTVPGLARLAIWNDQIFLTTWGDGEAFDGTLQVLKNIGGNWSLEIVADGFGNPEGVSVLEDSTVVVGTWRGLKDQTDARVFRVTSEGAITPIAAFNGLDGPADLLVSKGKLIVPMLGSGTLMTLPTTSLN